MEHPKEVFIGIDVAKVRNAIAIPMVGGPLADGGCEDDGDHRVGGTAIISGGDAVPVFEAAAQTLDDASSAIDVPPLERPIASTYSPFFDPAAGHRDHNAIISPRRPPACGRSGSIAAPALF